ncbi:Putative signal transducing protein [Paenimyroides aquimaris]|uniref:Putative signal transducing protein n=1 Tax=Paenimyroides marinum TaxID=1159016 RepID=A0A1H6MGT7_9FLAO|nr:DUF2007 domain-containing protein [Paenimyroides aquimaris]SEI00815.1 Putative signal transducing protein [Paenimyroides aquimaris]
MKLKTLKTFDSYIEAHLLKTKLESENIYCFLQDESLVATNPLYSFAVGGIKLQVKTTDYNTAWEILNENNPQMKSTDSNEICENCGHNGFYNNYKSVKGLKGFFSMLLSLMFQTYPVYYKNVWKCKKCGYETEIK